MNKNQKNNKILISASEISQYQYCSIAWKLKKLGYEPNSKALKIGKNKHKQYGIMIDLNEKLNKKSKIFVIISLILLITAVILIILEVLI